MAEIPYVRHPTEFPARYARGPDSFRQPGVPCGATHEYEWNDSRVFPGTPRRFWAYVPAQYASAEPASLMVFQDAEWYMVHRCLGPAGRMGTRCWLRWAMGASSTVRLLFSHQLGVDRYIKGGLTGR